jgi:hypothetical protein
VGSVISSIETAVAFTMPAFCGNPIDGFEAAPGKFSAGVRARGSGSPGGNSRRGLSGVVRALSSSRLRSVNQAPTGEWEISKR